MTVGTIMYMASPLPYLFWDTEVNNLNSKKNFTEGPIFWRITLFALPIMLTGVLQICYGMADNIVVGKFSGDPLALAAVGCTSTFSNLVINLLLGLAAGTGIVVAQCYGAKEHKLVSRGVHTAIIVALVGGILFMTVGLIICRPVLVLLGTKPELIDKSTLYLSIIFMGIPGNAVYNFGAAILRSTGDSKTPLLILSTAGLINVGLNLVFVIGCKMTVEGVAIATISSQYISAAAVLTALSMKRGECYAFSFKKLCFDKRMFSRIMRYGVPSGLQSAMFSISNMLMTGAVNTFPTTTITANTIASNIDAITYTSMNSFTQASMTFVGQNYGARNHNRIKKSFIYCILQVFVIGVLVAGLELILSGPLISLFVDEADPNAAIITERTVEIITLLLSTYVICGVMDVTAGAIRGLGYALSPMFINVFCICVMRVIWIYVFFPMERLHTITGLYLAYPITWTASLIAMLTAFILVYRGISRRFGDEKGELSETENRFSKA